MSTERGSLDSVARKTKHNSHHRPKSNIFVMDSLVTVAAKAAAREKGDDDDDDDDDERHNNNNHKKPAAAFNGKATMKKTPTKKRASTSPSTKANSTQSTPAAGGAKEAMAARERENQMRLEDDYDDDNDNPDLIVKTNDQHNDDDEDENVEDADDEEEDGNVNGDNNANANASTMAATTAAVASKKSGHHNKTYTQLAHDAIVALNDRSGSSQVAITKYMLQQYPELEQQPTFKSRFPNVLKMAVKSQRFVKVRASYKINVEWKKQQVKQKKAAAVEAAKRKKLKRMEQKALSNEGTMDASATAAAANSDAMEASKVEDLEQVFLTPLELAAFAKREEQARKKAEEERLKKERADRLRKRRFPMEDTKLHAEDKELNVKPPDNVKKPPFLPYFFATTLPFGDPRRKQGKIPLNAAAKCEAVEMGSRGLVPDLLTVYHFFRGDVHYYQMDDSGGAVPEFTLQQLVYAVQEILNGNAKRSKLVPPLLSHLFVTCLQILMPHVPPITEKNKNEMNSSNGNNNNLTNHATNVNVDPIAVAQQQLAKDLSRLSVGLCPASWADICFLYMDTMERYYTSPASNQNYHLPGLDALPGLHIDSRYLLHVNDATLEPMTPAKMNESNYLPTGYGGYMGDSRGALARGHSKLVKQDPWTLTAEELLALLRALVDDVLAKSPEISEDIAQRDEVMTKLMKEKRAADSQYRKIRLAFEGPKKPPKKTASAGAATDGKDAAEDVAVGERNSSEEPAEGKGDDEGKKQTKEWKPTASRRQLEAAQKAQQKADDAYEKGVRNLVARTEPVGYDRNFNSVYCFRHDPEVLYVEVLRPSLAGAMDGIPEGFQTKRSSWHVIETKSVFDEYVASLDVRGKREYALYDDLMGQPGAQSLRVSLFDDIKERASASSRRKELMDLKRKLENAKIKCDENRHSGRLAGRAVVEVSQLEAEIQDLERQIKGKGEPAPLNFEELTGLELLRTFDTTEKYKSRGSRSKKESTSALVRPRMPCSVLWPTGELDGTGVVGSIVTELVVLEERCDALCPVEDQSIRDDWITELEDAVLAWNSSATVVLGTGKAPPTQMDRAAVQFAGDVSPSSNRKSEVECAQSAHRRRSFGSLGSMGSVSDAKRRKLSSPSSQASNSNNLSTSQILAMVKKPLLVLEERIFNVTGLAMTASDLDLADANMSDDENDEGKGNQAWKKSVYRLKSITRRHGQVREAVIEAIAAARRAQLGSVVAQLRAALMLHHPMSSGACKNAALQVLTNHGGYDPDDDDQDDDDVNADAKKSDESEDACLLAEEAVVMESSLDGNEYAGRSDWIEAVKTCKTVSKLASLSCAFVRRASDKLGKLETEKKALLDALSFWAKEEERKQRNRTNGKKKNNRQSEERSFSTTEVWANVRFTEDYCMIKLDADPWWPAKKCVPIEEELAQSLASVNRTLVALLGEEGALRVVANNNIKPFTGKNIDEDMKGYNKEIRKQLAEAMAMGRRILRGRQRAGLKTTGLPNGNNSKA